MKVAQDKCWVADRKSSSLYHFPALNLLGYSRQEILWSILTREISAKCSLYLHRPRPNRLGPFVARSCNMVVSFERAR
jgi:hypothetical protein